MSKDHEIKDAIRYYERLKLYAAEYERMYPDAEQAPKMADLAITALRQYQKPTGETSDGYHTFNELYHHRAILFAALSKAYPDKAWKSRKHHDGTMFGDDWFICGIETPKGQYTYHYNTTYWPLFAGKILDNAPEWDGHKPEDVERLMSLRQMGSTEPCEWCVDKHSYSIRYGLGGDTHKHCPNCGRKLVKHDG